MPDKWTTKEEAALAYGWFSGQSLVVLDTATGGRCTVEREDADDKYHLLHRKVYGWLQRGYGSAYQPQARVARAGRNWSPRELEAIRYMRQKEARSPGSTYIDDPGYLARLFHRRPAEVVAKLAPPEEPQLW